MHIYHHIPHTHIYIYMLKPVVDVVPTYLDKSRGMLSYSSAIAIPALYGLHWLIAAGTIMTTNPTFCVWYGESTTPFSGVVCGRDFSRIVEVRHSRGHPAGFSADMASWIITNYPKHVPMIQGTGYPRPHIISHLIKISLACVLVHVFFQGY